ncbi:unnamed protein product [Phaedon cochleariae]|uniref:Spermatogenesis-associated protein 20-like TRX domain-containing protein n=1 Tax=Phaedon cochleariae TaxID=80249 RepID=A0A9P0D8G0_PHACE|nr:unnamed protein product [Phaedon cochleariae]
MLVCRAANNSSVIQGIFRRFSFSNGDLRVANNRATTTVSPISFSTKCVDAEKSSVRKSRLRSQSFGSTREYYKETIRTMSTEVGSSGSPTKSEETNRLILEKSPYLLQHATNPVDWFPWGQEAFDKAKAENKLIFLSVGYSTCHWCHVMEKESFENKTVAEIMNKHFINIKVDREERPDVDKLYMSFITATVGGGGWPMSVFLTPDLKPLAGGTYFPPEDQYGRPGFKSVLNSIAKQWHDKKTSILNSGDYALQVLKKVAAKDQKEGQNLNIPSEDAWKKCFLQLSRSYESDFGGFNSAPKFPQPVNFNFLFHMYSRNKKTEEGSQCLEMCLHTLKKMAYGGIHDHVNNGFARYSVDDKWHVPHFEKMLYDQGQLAVSYCDAYVLTKDEFYADVVRDILSYVSRDLSNVRPSQDPHGELKNKNVLACFGSYETTANKFSITIDKLKEILNKSHKVLYEARQERPKPHVDTKIVTAWNGLMISGFAKAGFVLKDQAYIDRGIQAAGFIKRYLYDGEEKRLLRCCYRGDDGGVVQTLAVYLKRQDLREKAGRTLAAFADRLTSIPIALPEMTSALMSYHNSPTQVFIAGETENTDTQALLDVVRSRFLPGRILAIVDGPGGRAGLLYSRHETLNRLWPVHGKPAAYVFIAGETENTDTQALLDVVRSRFLPGRILAIVDGPGGRAGLLYSRHETLNRLRPVHGKPAAYVCRNFACSLPVTEPQDLATSLDAGNGAKKEEEEDE